MFEPKSIHIVWIASIFSSVNARLRLRAGERAGSHSCSHCQWQMAIQGTKRRTKTITEGEKRSRETITSLQLIKNDQHGN